MFKLDEFVGQWTKEYANEINKGNIVIGYWLQLALNRIASFKNKYGFDPVVVNKRIEFIEKEASQVKGSNADFILALPQKVWIENWLGWQYKNDNGKVVRLVNELPIIMARGSGKTSLAAALADSDLILSKEYGAEIIFIGNTTEQADEGYNASREMFKRDGKMLNKLWKKDMIRSTKNGVVFEARNAKIKKKALVYDSLDGLNTTLNIFDEVHAYKQDPISVVNDGSDTKRDEWTSIYISTNGVVRGLVMDDRMAQWKRVLTGEENNDHIMPFIYQIDEISDIEDAANWQKAMPMLGITTKRSSVRNKINEAKNDPAKQTELLTKWFNYPLNSYASYFTNEDAQLNYNMFSYDPFYMRKSIIGVDMSEKNDLSAMSITTYVPEEDRFYSKTLQFIPEHVVEASGTAEKQRYRKFEASGELIIHDKVTNEADFMYSRFKQWLLDMKTIPVAAGFDRWGADNMMELMRKDNIIIEKVAMNVFTLSNPMKAMKAYIQSNKWVSDGDLIKWNYANVVAKIDANNNIFPNKAHALNKIDGFMSQMFTLIAYERNIDNFD